MTRKRKEPSIADELLDELLSGTDALQAFESGDLVQDLKKALAERILNAEMDHHLDVCPRDVDPGDLRPCPRTLRGGRFSGVDLQGHGCGARGVQGVAVTAIGAGLRDCLLRRCSGENP